MRQKNWLGDILILEKVDVVLLTKNSFSRSSVFPLTIESIFREIPVNRLIVVDGFSEDETINFLRRFPSVKVIYDEGNRATARQKGIEEVETDFFVFVDDDVILCNEWFKKAKELIHGKLGGLWGVAYPVEPLTKKYHEAMAKIYKMNIPQLSIRQGYLRGQMHDTLIRTSVVKDIKIPKDLHVYEDEYIRRWIEKKGYIWLPTVKPYCLHYKAQHSYKEGWLTGFLGKKYGYFPKKLFLKHVTFFMGKLGLLLLLTRNFKVFNRELKKELGFILGWLGV